MFMCTSMYVPVSVCVRDSDLSQCSLRHSRLLAGHREQLRVCAVIGRGGCVFVCLCVLVCVCLCLCLCVVMCVSLCFCVFV